MLAAEVDRVQQLLHEAAAGPRRDRAIHQARRGLKKTRALLRLFREPLGKDLCRQHVHALSKIADQLAPARDARVRLATLEQIAKQAGPAAAPAVEKLQQAFTTDLRHAERQSLDEESVAKLHQALNETLMEVAAAPLEDDGWKLLEAGIKRTCKRVLKAQAAAQDKGGAERFHKWRKRAKDLQYQLRLFRGASPGTVKQLEQKLDVFNEVLGDDHDLTLLEMAIKAKGAAFKRSKAALRLQATIDKRHQRLQRRALREGDKVLPDKPQAFTDDLAHAWKAWHRG